MSDNIKLVIEIPKKAKQAFDNAERNDLKGGYYDLGGNIGKAIQNGIPLDDVKAEIDEQYKWLMQTKHTLYDIDIAFSGIKSILDNIGKAESEDK